MSKIKLNIGGVIVEMEKDLVSKGIEAGELNIESDEVTILKKSDENIVYSKADFATFKTNLENQEYKKGRYDGAEMLTKELKKNAGLDYESKIVKNDTGNVDFEKTSDLFMTNLTPKIEEKIGIEPTEKLKEAQNNFDTLKNNYTKLETDFNTFKTGITEKETRIKRDNAILAYIPTTGLIVDRDIALISLKEKTGLDVSFDESGTQSMTIKGEVKKDEKLDSIDHSKLVMSSLESLNLIKKVDGGGGGGDDTGGGQSTDYDKFVKEMKVKNIEEGSEGFNEEMTKRISDKTLSMA